MVSEKVFQVCKEYASTLDIWPEDIYDIDGIHVLEFWTEVVDDNMICRWAVVYNEQHRQNYKIVHRQEIKNETT